MNNPIFLCVGTQKGGTSSLYNILRQHSELFLPETKELHFFDYEENFAKGTDFYFSYFKDAKKNQKCGEITPNYMYDPKVPERIKTVLGSNIKLIFVLRNPADRAFSQHKMRVGRGGETMSFKQAIELELKELKKDNYTLKHDYIHRSFYDEQIERYLKIFDKKNMLFIHFEQDFLRNREKTIRKIFEFLELNPDEKIGVNIKSTPGVKSKSERLDTILNTAHPINQFAKKIIPSKKLRTNIKYFFTKINQKPAAKISELEQMRPFLINEIYKKSILNLEKIIDRDLSGWLV